MKSGLLSLRRSAAVVAAAAGMVPTFSPIVLAQGDAAKREQAVRANRVALPSGRVVHTTPEPVLHQRLVALSGTDLSVLLWEQVDADGRQVPHYAFARDFRTPVGRVRATSYDIMLKYAAFDPLRGEPPVPASLTAPQESRLYLVQTVATPVPAMQEQLESAGAEILRFIPHHTMIVRMSPGARAKVEALPFVRWVGRFHVAYKLDEPVRAALLGAPDATARYSIEVFDRGMVQQQAVADLVRALGGTVEVFTPDQFRMEATLTPAQLLAVARRDEVHFIDPWGGPGEHDMDIVRTVSGANYIEGFGFTGQGVRGEVFDTEVRTTHQEFPFTITLHAPSTAGNAANPHGTSVMSIVFGAGTSATARGLLPNAEARIFCDYTIATQFGGAVSRLTLNSELVNPAGPYRAVFQTSSVGSTHTTTYTTISAEVDDYLYQTQLLSTQSMGNLASNSVRPQAWAKNIVSCGAVTHYNTASRADDTWTVGAGGSCGWAAGNGASTGLAADGRIKPDLSFFFDCINAGSNTSNTSYTQFGGTSAATPSVAGCFGLFFQMWHQQVWPGRGGASTVFASRAKMTTAKAALINTAFRYTWTAGGPNASITRNVQGWGQPDLQALYDRRGSTFIVDHDDVLLPLGVKTYYVRVQPGTPSLNVTLCYVDRMGSTTSSVARINDLSLRVTSPTGTMYWGNNGLTLGNTSTSGGSSNTVDTVENVFIASPTAGVWRIQVFGDEIVQDTHPATSAIDAVYSLWCTGATKVLDRGPYGYAVASNGNDHLYRIDLSTGDATDLGLVGLNDAEGLCFGPRGDMFAIGGTLNELWNVSLPPGTLVGTTGTRNGIDAGLEFFNGRMFNIQGNVSGSWLYEINSNTGAATLIGSNMTFLDNLAINGLGQAFGIDGITSDALWSVNLANGSASQIGSLGVGNIFEQFGTGFAEDHTLWALDSTGQIYTVNTATGAATRVARVDVGGIETGDFEGLAIDRTSACRVTALPAFNNTFSSGSLTRGFWFTSPANIEICGLRVPDEAGAGVQNIEIVRFNATPPTFPATTNNFVSLGRYVGVPGTNVIPVRIGVSAGDIIGVLGATGTTTMNNSYAGVSTFNTTIKELPVTLRRLGMQANLNQTHAANLWTESAQISRVEIYYKDGTNEIYLDGDTPATGSNLVTTPLSTVMGVVTFTGELVAFGDPELVAAGSLGNEFDIIGAVPNAAAELRFNFDVESITFIYGGNLGEINIEARNAANALVDRFYQSDTVTGQPAGPITLAGPGIRSLRWNDTTGNYASLDNIRIRATNPCYANCDGSTTPPVLNVADFTCFLSRFAAGDGYANCDGSTTPPVLNVADFTCFLTRFAAGCP